MATRLSQNGWPAYPDTSRYTRFTAAGQGWWAANADVAVVFTEFIERFDREVEEITQKTLDDWTYANRLVRGSTSVVSNHGSATAVDINALQHPRGVHNTFTPGQQRTMHRIRDDITDNAGRPVLRLGMDYQTTVDDMHVEIDVGERAVRQAADKIRKRKGETGMELTKENLRQIAEAVWSLKVIELTEPAANAIGSPDVKAGQMTSAQYLMQWQPLVRRLGREDASRDEALAEADRLRDARVQAAVNDLTLAIGQISRTGAGSIDVDVLSQTISSKLIGPLTTAIADQLAARLKS